MTWNYRGMLDVWTLALAAPGFRAIALIVAAVANLSCAVLLGTAPARSTAQLRPDAPSVPNGDGTRRNPRRCCGGRV